MTIHRFGNLRGEKIIWPQDGLNYCIWFPFPGRDDDRVGACFDIPGEDINDAIALLERLREAEPDVYEDIAHEEERPTCRD